MVTDLNEIKASMKPKVKATSAEPKNAAVTSPDNVLSIKQGYIKAIQSSVDHLGKQGLKQVDGILKKLSTMDKVFARNIRKAQQEQVTATTKNTQIINESIKTTWQNMANMDDRAFMQRIKEETDNFKERQKAEKEAFKAQSKIRMDMELQIAKTKNEKELVKSKYDDSNKEFAKNLRETSKDFKDIQSQEIRMFLEDREMWKKDQAQFAKRYKQNKEFMEVLEDFTGIGPELKQFRQNIPNMNNGGGNLDSKILESIKNGVNFIAFQDAFRVVFDSIFEQIESFFEKSETFRLMRSLGSKEEAEKFTSVQKEIRDELVKRYDFKYSPKEIDDMLVGLADPRLKLSNEELKSSSLAQTTFTNKNLAVLSDEAYNDFLLDRKRTGKKLNALTEEEIKGVQSIVNYIHEFNKKTGSTYKAELEENIKILGARNIRNVADQKSVTKGTVISQASGTSSLYQRLLGEYASQGDFSEDTYQKLLGVGIKGSDIINQLQNQDYEGMAETIVQGLKNSVQKQQSLRGNDPNYDISKDLNYRKLLNEIGFDSDDVQAMYENILYNSVDSYKKAANDAVKNVSADANTDKDLMGKNTGGKNKFFNWLATNPTTSKIAQTLSGWGLDSKDLSLATGAGLFFGRKPLLTAGKGAISGIKSLVTGGGATAGASGVNAAAAGGGILNAGKGIITTAGTTTLGKASGIAGMALDGFLGYRAADKTFNREKGKATAADKTAGAIGGALGGSFGYKENASVGKNVASVAVGAGTGALKGAAVGGTIGSVIPVVGTAVGAGAGAIVGAILGAIGGENIAKFTKNVMSGTKEFVTNTGEKMKGWFQDGSGFIKDKWNEATNNMWDKNKSFLENYGNLNKKARDGFINMHLKMYDTIKAGGRMFDKATGGFLTKGILVGKKIMGFFAHGFINILDPLVSKIPGVGKAWNLVKKGADIAFDTTKEEQRLLSYQQENFDQLSLDTTSNNDVNFDNLIGKTTDGFGKQSDLLQKQLSTNDSGFKDLKTTMDRGNTDSAKYLKQISDTLNMQMIMAPINAMLGNTVGQTMSNVLGNEGNPLTFVGG